MAKQDPMFEYTPQKIEKAVEQIATLEADCLEYSALLDARADLYKRLDNLLSRSYTDPEEVKIVTDALENLRANVQKDV